MKNNEWNTNWHKYKKSFEQRYVVLSVRKAQFIDQNRVIVCENK